MIVVELESYELVLDDEEDLPPTKRMVYINTYVDKDVRVCAEDFVWD